MQGLVDRVASQIEDEFDHFLARENRAARFDPGGSHSGHSGFDLTEASERGLGCSRIKGHASRLHEIRDSFEFGIRREKAHRVTTAGPISLTVIAFPGCTVAESYHSQFPCPENPGECERLASRRARQRRKPRQASSFKALS